MGLHMCPLEPRVQKLFGSSTKKLSNRRIPIAERARLAYENRAISYDAALHYSEMERFLIGTNEFEIFNQSKFVDNRFIALAISHFGSVFKNTLIHILAEDKDDSPIMAVKAFRTDLIGRRNNFIIEYLKGAPLGTIEFRLFESRRGITMADFVSNVEGHGGKMLVALYNLAKDLEIKKMHFDVDVDDTNAAQFYFHMDFGRPKPWIRALLDMWEVKIEGD